MKACSCIQPVHSTCGRRTLKIYSGVRQLTITLLFLHAVVKVGLATTDWNYVGSPTPPLKLTDFFTDGCGHLYAQQGQIRAYVQIDRNHKMNANNTFALKAYKDVKTNVAVDTSDQHSLVSMLFSGVLDCLIKVESSFETSDLETRTFYVSKSQSILHGLRSTLDHTRGGEIARLLDSLYDYCNRQLTRSLTSKDAEPVQEVKGLIRQISEAWDSMPVEAYRQK